MIVEAGESIERLGPRESILLKLAWRFVQIAGGVFLVCLASMVSYVCMSTIWRHELLRTALDIFHSPFQSRVRLSVQSGIIDISLFSGHLRALSSF